MDLLSPGSVATRRGHKTIRHLLAVVDAYSRYAMTIPLESKRPRHVLAAIHQAHTAMGKPRRVEINNGAEFRGVVDEYLQREGIAIRRGECRGHRHQALVRAFHRGLNQKLVLAMRTGNGSWQPALLTTIMKNYNSSFHSGLRGVPTDVFAGKVQPAVPPARIATHGLPELSPGDHVRYACEAPSGASHRRTHDQVWSDEIVMVERTVGAHRGPRLHYLLNAEGKTIERPYYREELLEVHAHTDTRT